MQHNVIWGLMTNDWPEKIFFLRPITIKSSVKDIITYRGMDRNPAK